MFSQVVLLLVECGQVTLKEAFLDDTKIEANANRYTFVWGRSIRANKERIKKQLKELWVYAEQVAREELENNEPEVFEQINQEKVKVCKKLNSERGIIYRSRRPVEVEAVFGMIKSNRNYRRFLLRGIEKVEIEAGLLALAHNLNKMASKN